MHKYTDAKCIGVFYKINNKKLFNLIAMWYYIL